MPEEKYWLEKERRIVREACLKASIEYNKIFQEETTTDTILKDAEKFEEWVYR